jgi:hypothetical protein
MSICWQPLSMPENWQPDNGLIGSVQSEQTRAELISGGWVRCIRFDFHALIIKVFGDFGQRILCSKAAGFRDNLCLKLAVHHC